MIFLSFPVCCLALLHTKHSLCLEWWLQPTGFRLGMKDRVAKYAESLGEREVGLDVPQRAGCPPKGWMERTKPRLGLVFLCREKAALLGMTVL